MKAYDIVIIGGGLQGLQLPHQQEKAEWRKS